MRSGDAPAEGMNLVQAFADCPAGIQLAPRMTHGYTPKERPVSKAVGPSARGRLRDVFADVFREHLVDERLVADVSAARFLAERLEHARIDANRDQSSRFVAKRRPPYPSHRLELFGRRLGNVRVVNPSRRTPCLHGTE